MRPRQPRFDLHPTRNPYRAIGDPTRRSILELLARGDKTVSELCTYFDVSQPNISQHLKVLRESGLVRQRQEGRRTLYVLEAGPLRMVEEWLGKFERVRKRRK
jgi:DNA-binding transcriptional ArsR family regulator